MTVWILLIWINGQYLPMPTLYSSLEDCMNAGVEDSVLFNRNDPTNLSDGGSKCIEHSTKLGQTPFER